MRELSIEEKAKAYDEALQRAKGMHEEGMMPERIEYIFPELKESEEERIMKCIVLCLEECVHNDIIRDYEKDECLAWFEKQGGKTNPYSGISFEYNGHIWGMCARDNGVDILLDKQLFKHLEKQSGQKPTDKVEPKFKIGDKVNRNDREDEEYNILTITSVNIDEHCYTCHQDSVIDFEEQDLWHIVVEQKPAWSKEDEKMKNLIISTLTSMGTLNLERYHHMNLDEVKEWFNKYLKDRVQSQHRWKQENTDDLTDFENAMMHIGGSFFGENAGLDPNDTNAIKEQANILLELVPKQEWSEEDEYQFNTILHYLNLHAELYKKERNNIEYNRWQELYNWLKSHKNKVVPQEKVEWSEEDENIRREIINYLTTDHEDGIRDGDKVHDYTVQDLINWLNSKS